MNMQTVVTTPTLDKAAAIIFEATDRGMVPYALAVPADTLVTMRIEWLRLGGKRKGMVTHETLASICNVYLMESTNPFLHWTLLYRERGG